VNIFLKLKYVKFFLTWFACSFMINNLAKAQVSLEQLHTIQVSDGATDIAMPWIGGLNSAQYGKVDLDNDGTEELVIYDRSANIFNVFSIIGNKLVPAFHLAQYLPEIPAGWVLFLDYNLDGKKDIFSNGDRGIIVYKNVSTSGQGVQWKKVADPLYTTGFTGKINLIANAADVPAITDIDGDSDVDILVYNFAVGGTIRYNRNLSMDIYGHADSLEFEIKSRSWGEFEECDCNEFAFNGQTCADLSNGRVEHPGGKALLAFDNDGDGDRDLLVGHEQCEELYFYENMGDQDSAYMTGYSGEFPEPANPANFHIFPAAFFEDLNFDGIKDLVVCPAFEENFEYKIDFAHSNKLYLNTATDQSPSFSFSQDDFIQSMSLDFGEYSVPVLADLNADGLSDLLVSANGYWNGNFFNGYITVLRNTGTTDNPSFTIVDEDYLNLSTLKLVNPVIGLADMNNDESFDLLYWAVNSMSYKPECRIILNTAAADKPAQFDSANPITLSIPSSAEMGDSPCFYDVDGDGYTDLLLGKKNGALEYYRNSGNNTFTLENAAYLDIERDFQQYRLNLVASVSDIDGNTIPDLLVTDARGMARVYFDFQSQPENGAEAISIVLTNPNDNQEDTARFDSKTWISGADLFNLGSSSLIIGGARGGLQFFKNPAVGIGENESDIVLRMYPNPVHGISTVTFRADRDLQANLLTVLGQQVLATFTIGKYQDTFLETATLRNGIYILSVNDDAGNRTAQLLMVGN
jgi:hypothetical protein